jgi:hypothetical protein
MYVTGWCTLSVLYVKRWIVNTLRWIKFSFYKFAILRIWISPKPPQPSNNDVFNIPNTGFSFRRITLKHNSISSLHKAHEINLCRICPPPCFIYLASLDEILYWACSLNLLHVHLCNLPSLYEAKSLFIGIPRLILYTKRRTIQGKIWTSLWYAACVLLCEWPVKIEGKNHFCLNWIGLQRYIFAAAGTDYFFICCCFCCLEYCTVAVWNIIRVS